MKTLILLLTLACAPAFAERVNGVGELSPYQQVENDVDIASCVAVFNLLGLGIKSAMLAVNYHGSWDADLSIWFTKNYTPAQAQARLPDCLNVLDIVLRFKGESS